jgi:competence protein ComEC
LVPWLAVAFGSGTVVYFSIDREPIPWATVLLLAAAVAVTVFVRRRALAFPVAVGFAAAAAGFCAASVKRAIVTHPVLSSPGWNVDITGFVETREERERSDRITVRIERISAPRLDVELKRVRVSVRKGTAPAVGSFIGFRARLSPPLEPLRPGGYDFARDMYFQGIAASGFVLGRIRSEQPPHAAALSLRYAALMDGMREAIDKRIRTVLPGDKGAIASALITGKRDAITSQVNEAMYVSGLAHVLSISGYHMAVVAGIVFFVVRAFFALLPTFANRHPIKKWAAFAALIASAFYLLLSGAEVATQLSFIMIAIVLIGVIVDRATFTFRSLTVAALCVLLLAPEAVVHPSFQMSFAATLALIAGYQFGLPWTSHGGDTPLAARIALWGGREIIGLVLVSLLAGTATIPYIAYHFHRFSPYGMVANLIAMPVVSAWVMPWGIIGVLAMSLGLDGWCWHLMGAGIDWMSAIAIWVTSFPGALGRTSAFGAVPLLLSTIGLVVVCLLRTPLRFVGIFAIASAVVMMLRAPQPDILVAPDGNAVAVRGNDGRFAIWRSGTDTFAAREWLASDADARSPKDDTLAERLRRDSVGCLAALEDSTLVSIARSIEAFEEDCVRAAVVISVRDAPADCGSFIVDRQLLRRSGAIALRRVDRGFELTPARSPGYDRPWAPSHADSLGASEQARPAQLPRDATPRLDDLEVGD